MSDVIGWSSERLLAGFSALSGMALPLIGLALFVAFVFGFALLTSLTGSIGRRYKEKFLAAVGGELNRSFIFVSPGRLFALHCTAVLVSAALAWMFVGHPVAALIAALMFAGVPGLVLGQLRKRRAQRFRQQMPEVIALIAGAMRAGSSLNGALAEVARQLPAPANQEMALMLRQSRMGSTLDQAIDNLQARMPVEETVLLVSALRVGRRSGGSVAATLDALSESVRRKLVLEAKIRALTAQGRLQAWVMALLPALVLLALLLIDSNLVSAYFGDVRGGLLVTAVFLMQLCGGLLIRRIITIEI